MTDYQKVPGSFRDPNGFIFMRQGEIFRQINTSYQQEYDYLVSSGLYKELVDNGLLVSHEEVAFDDSPAEAYRIIKPQQIPFISYPYEWSFGQLKDAALTTLQIQRKAMSKGMILKDASAYNIQFVGSRPVFIDTLSFERYVEGQPWIAYRQFCQHFLAPLALMAYCDIRCEQLLRTHIDGIPLDFAARLLPIRTRIRPGLAIHLHAHARTQVAFANQDETNIVKTRKVSKNSLIGFVENLELTVRSLHWKAPKTEWADYYDGDSYNDVAFDAKKQVVKQMIEAAQPQQVWDLGANTGVFSRLASEQNILTIAWDIDPGAVERNYQNARSHKIENLLPLLLDLTNPSPGLGWAHQERASVLKRAKADLIMGLALIHHLAISNNVPLADIASYFAALAPWLIIEFVPKSDPKVKKLLITRQDIFPDYTVEGFKKAFEQNYTIIQETPIPDLNRMLFLLQRKQAQ